MKGKRLYEERVEVKKAKEIISMRNYKILSESVSDEIVEYLVLDPKTSEKILIWCIMPQDTLGIRYINMLKKKMKSEEVERGIVISQGTYTHSARMEAKRRGIELIPKVLPSFKLFDHFLVPEHRVISEEEREELLTKYKVRPHQLPKIKASDPAIIAIGAKPGDIVKIVRESPTAGKYVSYRYVVS